MPTNSLSNTNTIIAYWQLRQALGFFWAVGVAVVRNRCKRRLREAARLLAPLHGRPGCDYVFIGRMGTADRDWDPLLDDVKSALTRLATPRAAPDMGDEVKSPARASDDSRPSGQDR